MLASEPEDPFLRYAIAIEYRKTDKTKALQMLEELATSNPEYPATYYILAEMYQEVGRMAEALATYQKGIAICQQVQDRHALSELQRAYQQLQEELEE